MKKLTDRLIQKDALLESYRESIERRLEKTVETESRLTEGKMSLAEFASGHEYFGLHLRDGRWVFREWAPNASALSLVGDMTDWKEKKGFALDRAGTDGIWEISLPADSLKHGDLYRLRIHWPAGKGDRIPAWTRRDRRLANHRRARCSSSTGACAPRPIRNCDRRCARCSPSCWRRGRH